MPARLVSTTVKRVAKIRENDFREIWIKAAQLIELALESLLPGGSCASQSEDRRRSNRDRLSRWPREPIDHQSDHDYVGRNADHWMFDREPKQEPDQQIDECA